MAQIKWPTFKSKKDLIKKWINQNLMFNTHPEESAGIPWKEQNEVLKPMGFFMIFSLRRMLSYSLWEKIAWQSYWYWKE